MKATSGNLGPIPYILQTSLEKLDIEMVLPLPSNSLSSKLGIKNLKPELCHPLKILLGNYLSVIGKKPEKVIFYDGCDLCNLSCVHNVFLEIFAEKNWRPEPVFLNIAKKELFIKDYYCILKKISGKSSLKVINSMILGLKKLFLFDYLDRVFYLIRPVIKDYNTGEKFYNELYTEIISSKSLAEYKKIRNKINKLLQKFSPDYSLPHIGLFGDPYSLYEPFSHQYTDRKLGYLGVITDRWFDNPLIKRKEKNLFKIQNILKNNYGVLTFKEFKKLNVYIRKSYEGLVFIAPFTCNPNDALRNQLSVIQEKTGIPILSLSFDEHTSPTGIETRLEAFVDLIKRKTRVK